MSSKMNNRLSMKTEDMPALPWEKLGLTEDQERTLYRDWAFFFAQKLRLELADYYNGKALELGERDTNVLRNRSQCRRLLARVHDALSDSLAAKAIKNNSSSINWEVCDALYELNQFEENIVEVHHNIQRFTGIKTEKFNSRLDVVEENFKDALGDGLGPFFLRNEHALDAVITEREIVRNHANRPLWKILRDEEKCDVVSILEKEEEWLSPLEIARRERMFQCYHEHYYKRFWIDVLYMRNLRHNNNLLLPYSRERVPVLRKLVNEKYQTVRSFIKMLQARSPLYSEHYKACPQKELCEKVKQSNLFRIQYNTRRNMLFVLRNIRRLRKTGQIKDLENFVETIMGDYVVLKTHRVMPWKFEFLNEVYNTLALAYADFYLVTLNSGKKLSSLTLPELLRFGSHDSKMPTAFVFGNKCSYTDPDKPDWPFITYKRKIERFEHRLHFAKYPIERSYVFHAMSLLHFEQSRYEECCSSARKASDEAKRGNNYLWEFLGQISIMRARSVVGKVESTKGALEYARFIAEKLQSTELCAFVMLCGNIIETKLSLRRQTRSAEALSIRKMKSLHKTQSRVDNENRTDQ